MNEQKYQEYKEFIADFERKPEITIAEILKYLEIESQKEQNAFFSALLQHSDLIPAAYEDLNKLKLPNNIHTWRELTKGYSGTVSLDLIEKEGAEND